MRAINSRLPGASLYTSPTCLRVGQFNLISQTSCTRNKCTVRSFGTLEAERSFDYRSCLCETILRAPRRVCLAELWDRL